MHTFLEKIDERIEKLKEIIEEKEIALNEAPQGVVNICNTNGRTQYYFKESSKDPRREYLKNEQKQLVRQLCQKDYDEKVLLTAQKELKQLEKAKKSYPTQFYESIYAQLSDERKTLVEPVFLSDEEFVKRWEQAEYEKMGFREDTPEYYTDRGERVRSKTEIIIANELNKHAIPYRYECPMYLNGLGLIHPDFTVLNVNTRKEMYWEHMGMMDDPDYAEKALQKIEAYEKNDIFPGDRLILTHETLKHPINSKVIEKMILKYLK